MMYDIYHHSAEKVTTAALCFLIIFQAGCAHHRDFHNQRVKRRPRSRIGRYASTTVGTVFVDPGNLGLHGYSNARLERTGIVYTCKAGHIDIAHVRKAADWTVYLAANTLAQLEKNETEFSFKFKEPSRYFAQLTYPDWWQNLPQDEKDRITRDISIRLGQYFAYVGCTWHEILTWFGYRSIRLYPEFPSAFSWEDSFSDLLGAHIGAEALRDTDHEYDQAMTLALNRELEDLGVQSRRTAISASRKVRGLWFSGDFLFLVDMKGRNFDIGLDDGFVTPWLVPSLPECEGAQPRSYPAPNLDFLDEYGFSIKLEIEPRVLERGKILSIVYPRKGPEGPDRKERKKRLEPAVHFAAIMDYIKEDAEKKYDYVTDPTGDVGSGLAPPQGALGAGARTISQSPPEGSLQQPHIEQPSRIGADMSISIVVNVDDVNNDNVVDFQDVAILVDTWLARGVLPGGDGK